MANLCTLEISRDEDIDICLVSVATPLPRESDVQQRCWADKSKSKCVIAPWKPCHIVSEQSFINENDEEERSVIVRFGDRKMDLPNCKLAWAKRSKYFHSGARVVAFRRSVDLPYIVNAGTCQTIPLYDRQERHPYPGMLAAISENEFHHMIFFDDGHVQKVKNEDIRLVYDFECLEHAHSNAKAYFKFYQSLEKHHEILPTIDQLVSIELNGDWVSAVTTEIDLPLAKFCFKQDEQPDRYEWLYLGSPRIEQVWRKLIESKVLDKLFNFTHVETDSSADDEDCIMIERCSQPSRASRRINQAPEPDGRPLHRNHECNHDCMRLEDETEIKKFSLFHRPLAVGFKYSVDTRSGPFYKSPCNRILRTYGAIREYLAKVNSKLCIESFSLERNFQPSENHQLPRSSVEVIDHDNLPISICDSGLELDKNFNYITENKLAIKDVELENSLNRCCDCANNCEDKEKCSCWRLTIEKLLGRPINPNSNDLDDNKAVGYKNFRLKNHTVSGIVECGAECKCNVDKCENRLVQRGLQLKLQLFQTASKGRGVRTLTDLPRGTFVVSYIGEIIDNEIARSRSNCYQFSLGEWSVERKTPSPPLNAKRARLESDEVVQDFLNFFPKVVTWHDESDSESESDSSSQEDAEEKEEFVVDSLYSGNISRFFNHSCNPNMFEQRVFVGDDERFPAIAFFTKDLVKAGDELTFDYRYELMDEHRTLCRCGEKNCRGRLS
ncbi:histone-lysine N-methyltransferase eggless-like [Sitodiplosis mosellana]|uniref:histone-lysine N-methyltransferase eggless-like n=1 Tax=Sitodiplosis mosellana TaxID=263140 RepID=UPI002444D406|nr:histone-lysine N-methyltransferase eggless-like [Sitodiplosis mosellana]